jgi:predicted N-acetyltransferase YhbS
MNFKIENISEHPEFIKTIADWHIKQWGHILPRFTPESYAAHLSSHYRKSGVPALFVAVDESKVIGTAALENDDMDTHPKLSPWLASVYVDVKYRKNGVGETLVRRVIEEARTAKAKELYLFTPDRAHYYSRFGWKLFFKEEYYGDTVSVMVLGISPHTPSR